MKARYNVDEWYPVYTLCDPAKGDICRGSEIDIPSEKYKEYVSVMKKFYDIQEYIHDFLQGKK